MTAERLYDPNTILTHPCRALTRIKQRSPTRNWPQGRIGAFATQIG